MALMNLLQRGYHQFLKKEDHPLHQTVASSLHLLELIQTMEKWLVFVIIRAFLNCI
jgi:hypothetical protein